MECLFLISCSGAFQPCNLWRSENMFSRKRFTLPARTLLKALFVRVASIRQRRPRPWILFLLVLIAISLVAGSIVYLTSSVAPSNEAVGRAFFFSSGLISTSNNQGTTDEFHLSMQGIHSPSAGKSYYGWLTGDGSDTPVAFGPLSSYHGQITLNYNDPNHTNLLAYYNRLLITEESADQPPVSPSLDASDWRYSAAFSTTPTLTEESHFSLLDHLRHLLARDPKLEKAGLQGGLGVWLYRNTTKVLEAAGSARDALQTCKTDASGCDTYFILRQVARILDYLDGANYVSIEHIPPAIQGDQLLIDPTIAKVSLLEFDPIRQQPPGYLEHIGLHLRGLIQSPGVTSEQRALANQINLDVNNVQGWLSAVHTDAVALIQMNADELLQPGSTAILNDLFRQANAAFVGQIDPNTNQIKEGVIHIYYKLQALATFDVFPCIIQNGQNSCAEKGGGE